LSDGQQINFSNISRESGVSLKTVRAYFQLLEDTLMGKFVPIYQQKAKRRLSKASKFYFFDVGVVNHLAKRGQVQKGSELFGYAFENYIFHELRQIIAHLNFPVEIQFWRTSAGDEVDFILNGAHTAIEVKSSSKINKQHLKSLRKFKELHPEITRHIVVCLEERSYTTEDGIEILNLEDFTKITL
jgi:predicted AAA+ superfamily ATPase